MGGVFREKGRESGAILEPKIEEKSIFFGEGSICVSIGKYHTFLRVRPPKMDGKSDQKSFPKPKKIPCRHQVNSGGHIFEEKLPKSVPKGSQMHARIVPGAPHWTSQSPQGFSSRPQKLPRGSQFRARGVQRLRIIGLRWI